jgi:hypothetical protein
LKNASVGAVNHINQVLMGGTIFRDRYSGRDFRLTDVYGKVANDIIVTQDAIRLIQLRLFRNDNFVNNRVAQIGWKLPLELAAIERTVTKFHILPLAVREFAIA